MAAESPLSLFSRLDEQHNSPLWKAFDRFRGTLNGGETSEFTEVTLEAVLFKVRDLDQQHAVSNQTRSISQRLEPLIQFLDRHAKALDCMAQTQPNPSALIWGMLRIILEVSRSSMPQLQMFCIGTNHLRLRCPFLITSNGLLRMLKDLVKLSPYTESMKLSLVIVSAFERR